MHMVDSPPKLRSTFVPDVTFSHCDTKGISSHEEDPIVINMQLFNWDVGHILLDFGSSDKVFYLDIFERLLLDL